MLQLSVGLQKVHNLCKSGDDCIFPISVMWSVAEQSNDVHQTCALVVDLLPHAVCCMLYELSFVVVCFLILIYHINTLFLYLNRACDVLVQVVMNHFPYLRRPSHEHECFVYNMLKVTEYQPRLRLEFLIIIFKRYVSL